MAQELPHSTFFRDTEAYINSLLEFTTSSHMFQMLCGGVHILDFFTTKPDIYTALLPQAWRDWFRRVTTEDVLNLLMRTNLTLASSDLTQPPGDLIEYVKNIRLHNLRRDFDPGKKGHVSAYDAESNSLARNVAVGMKPKKKHEVQSFANYIDKLATQNEITHLVDFGSGQNYLGRALASRPYNRHVVAMEERTGNIKRAQRMDAKAKISKTEGLTLHNPLARSAMRENSKTKVDQASHKKHTGVHTKSNSSGVHGDAQPAIDANDQTGSLLYVQHNIEDGDLGFFRDRIPCLTTQLDPLFQPTFSERNSPRDHQSEGPRSHEAGDCNGRNKLDDPALTTKPVADLQSNLIAIQNPRVMVISLHSCGNLVHHGLRSLLLNDFVSAVALVGCCYNLVTERLGPPTFKLPSLRSLNPRLVKEQLAYDPHGFPMSERLANYPHKRGPGIRFNITARMMAVQAPQNWTSEGSNDFFTRHYYRALLQKILHDRGVVSHTVGADPETGAKEAGYLAGTDPVIIGSLRKACYTSFHAYVRGAVSKLTADLARGKEIDARMSTLTDEEITRYEEEYRDRRKELSIVWSLMAFSATVVEAAIVVDRWHFLREQKEVERCWVDSIFEYRQSPRNLVVVGIKRRSSGSNFPT